MFFTLICFISLCFAFKYIFDFNNFKYAIIKLNKYSENVSGII